MAKQTFTDTFVRNLPAPEKQVEIYDNSNAPGLALRLSPGGSKTFVFRYRFNKSVKRYTIGRYPAISLAVARKKAQQLQALVSDGIDPVREKQSRKQAPEEITVSQLAERYKEWHLPKLKASTQHEYTRQIDNVIIKKLGKRPVKGIERSEIVSLLESIAKKAPVNSNRLKAVLSSMFSFAVGRALIERNIIKDIKPIGKERSRDRVLTEDEIKRFWHATATDEHPVITGLFRMLLILGQRSGETKKMKWDQIDFDRKLWTIPAEQTKNGQEHIAPLNEIALDVLYELRQITGDKPYVFQSTSNRGKGHIIQIEKAMQRIRGRAKAPDIRIHDLRRSAATYMSQLGVNRVIVGKTLNHKGLSGDGLVTAIYDRYSYLDEKRQALERWGNELRQILEGREDGARVYHL